MDNGIVVHQRLELRDESGNKVGYCIAGQAFDDLIAERDKLRAELADVTAERDGYLKSLHSLLRTQVSFTPVELEEMRKNAATGGEILQDLEAMLAGASQRDR